MAYCVVVDLRVMGIAELNDNIYVVVASCNKIKVFTGFPWYNRLENIVVKAMKDPLDLAVDLTTGHLYIADCAGHCVWRLEVKDKQDSNDNDNIQMDKLDIEARQQPFLFFPSSLSVTEAGQVLILDRCMNELTIWSSQGNRSEVIKLMDNDPWNTPRHVIQSSLQTFLVAHEDLVSLFDQKWKLLKQYGGLRLSEPQYLAEVSADGHMFLVDKERILILSPRLEVERTLVLRPSKSEDPVLGWGQRLFFSRSSGNLMVAWGGKYLWVYSIT